MIRCTQGRRDQAHRPGITQSTRTGPAHTPKARREGPRSWYKVSLKWLVVLKCTEQALRVPQLTGLGGVSRLEPGPASLSAAPQPPPCLKCCSWEWVPTPMPTATPIIYQGLPCLGPLPGLTGADRAALWWTGGPPWGGVPGEVARAPAGMGYGTY